MQIVRNAWSWPLPRTYGSFFFVSSYQFWWWWVAGRCHHTHPACQPHPTDTDLVAACDKRPWLILLIPEKSVAAKTSTRFTTPAWQKLDDCGGGNQVLWHVCCLNCRIPTAPLSSRSIAFLLDNYTPTGRSTRMQNSILPITTCASNNAVSSKSSMCATNRDYASLKRCNIVWLQQNNTGLDSLSSRTSAALDTI